jgi:type II secretory pathway component GspD/PulD (secretin)/Tfp pilus assembly protein PilF
MRFKLEEEPQPAVESSRTTEDAEVVNRVAQASGLEAPDLETLYRNGKNFYRAGDYQRAIECFEQILSVEPEYQRAERYLKESRRRLGKQQSAEQQESARQPEQIEQAQEELNEADQEMAESDKEAERERLEAMQEAQEEKIESLYDRARGAYSDEDYEGAIDLVEKVLAEEPEHRRARSLLEKSTERLERQRREAFEEKVDQQIELAEDHLDAERYDEAMTAYRQALKLDPGNREAQQGLEEAAEEKAEAIARAEEEAREAAMRERQERIDSLVDQGEDQLRDDQYDKAIDSFKQALKLDPESREAQRGLEDATEEKAEAQARAEEEAREEAERQFQERVENLAEKAEDYLDEDQYEEAIDTFEQVLQLDPGNRDAQAGIEEAAEEKAEAQARAEEQAREAAEREREEQIESLVDRGESQLDEDRYTDAIAAFEQVLQLDPENSTARKRLADAVEQKQEAEAEQRREELESRLENANEMAEQGQFEEAIEEIKSVMSVSPEFPGAEKSLERAQDMKAEAEEKAREEKRKAMAAELQQYFDRAKIFLEADQLDRAESELNQVMEKDPENEKAAELMSQVEQRRSELAAEQAKREEEARKAEEARRAQEVQQLFTEAKEKYVAGDVIAAVDLWNQVLEINPDHQETLTYLQQTQQEYQAAVEEQERLAAEQARQAEIEALLNQNVPLLDLKDTDIDNVLSLLSTISGFNIVATEGVEGIITVNIRDKTVREALDMILLPNGFKYTIDGKDITVTTDFKTRIFQLTAEQYDKIEKILDDPQSLEDPRRDLRRLIYGETGVPSVVGKDLRLNPNTRALIVTDTEENIKKVEAFLEDIPSFVEAEEPLVSRHFKLDPEAAQQIYNLIELTLYGELGRRALAADDPRLLVLEEDTNIMIVKDTVERIKEVEAILQNQSLLDRLKSEELVAQEFQVAPELIAAEPDEENEEEHLKWEELVEREVDFVYDIMEQMLYGYEGRDEAMAKGRRIFRRTDERYFLKPDGTITVVDTPQNIKKVEDFLAQGQGRGGVVIETIRIQHADINAVKDFLNRVSGRVRSREDTGGGGTGEDIDRQLRMRVTLHADPNTQSIIIRSQAASRDQLEALRDLAKKIDVPSPQVEIEARLVEIALGEDTGLTFDYDFFELFEDSFQTDPENRTTTLGMIGNTAAGLGFSMSTIGNTRFNFAMNAIHQLSNAEILSAPKITVTSDYEASINVTSTLPYVSSIEYNTQGTAGTQDDFFLPQYEQEQIGITMTVTPTVLGDGSVVMNVDPTISTSTGRIPVPIPAEAGGAAGVLRDLGQPIVEERSATTRVRVKNGDTLVIGGLIRDETTKSIDKVPVLGDLPWVGRFFKDTSESNSKSQLLIFITVRVLTD